MNLRHLRTFAAALVIGLLTAVGASAQTALNTTTLSVAVTSTTAQSVTVASATNITASTASGSTQTWIFVDGELMYVTAKNGSVLTVSRGAQGSVVSTHAVNAFVYILPAATAMVTVDPFGSCTATNYPYTPLINPRSGLIWNCQTSVSGTSLWMGYGLRQQQDGNPRTAVAGTAYTILPTDYLVVLSTISNAVATKSFTLPSHLGLAGKQLIIKDESGGVSGTTSVILVGTIDGTNSGTATVVQLKTPFGAVGLEAGSGGWFTIWCHGGNGSQVCR